MRSYLDDWLTRPLHGAAASLDTLLAREPGHLAALLSKGALLERLGREPVIIEPISQSTEGDNHDVLRQQASNTDAGNHEANRAEKQFFRDSSASIAANRQ